VYPSTGELAALQARAERAEQEAQRLKRLALTCCSCRQELASLDELKEHMLHCPAHPIAVYVELERAACAKIAEDFRSLDGDIIAERIRRRGYSPEVKAGVGQGI